MASEPVNRLDAEADQARTKVAETIDVIQDKLDPRRLLSQSLETITGSTRDLFSKAGDGARGLMTRHPLSIGAAVAAIGLGLLARRSLAHARVDLGDDFTSYTDYDDGFGYPEAPLTTGGTADPAQPHKASQRFASGKARISELAASTGGKVESNPLASIVIGLAAGAILGTLFPTTEAERRIVGGTQAD